LPKDERIGYPKRAGAMEAAAKERFETVIVWSRHSMVALALCAAVAGCRAQAPAPAPLPPSSVTLPDTPQAAACAQRCDVARCADVCQAGTDSKMYTPSEGDACRQSCARARDRCLQQCPGAQPAATPRGVGPLPSNQLRP